MFIGNIQICLIDNNQIIATRNHYFNALWSSIRKFAWAHVIELWSILILWRTLARPLNYLRFNLLNLQLPWIAKIITLINWSIKQLLNLTRAFRIQVCIAVEPSQKLYLSFETSNRILYVVLVFKVELNLLIGRLERLCLLLPPEAKICNQTDQEDKQHHSMREKLP